ADSTTPADRARLQAIRRGFAGVLRFDRVLLTDVRAGRYAQATAVVQGGADHAADVLSTAADAYRAAADRDHATAEQQFSSTRTLAQWVVLIVSLIAAALAA